MHILELAFDVIVHRVALLFWFDDIVAIIVVIMLGLQTVIDKLEVFLEVLVVGGFLRDVIVPGISIFFSQFLPEVIVYFIGFNIVVIDFICL